AGGGSRPATEESKKVRGIGIHVSFVEKTQVFSMLLLECRRRGSSRGGKEREGSQSQERGVNASH
ncbi:MAG TPA: hypothetical protein VFB30_21440, partial [Spirochaetia bacterium]|nr:hypothetical protein [Spirochaetia bacterium]